MIANDALLEANAWGGHLAACASEEMEHCQAIPDAFPHGNYLLLFDPLYGSSNIDVNVDRHQLDPAPTRRTVVPRALIHLARASAAHPESRYR